MAEQSIAEKERILMDVIGQMKEHTGPSLSKICSATTGTPVRHASADLADAPLIEALVEQECCRTLCDAPAVILDWRRQVQPAISDCWAVSAALQVICLGQLPDMLQNSAVNAVQE